MSVLSAVPARPLGRFDRVRRTLTVLTAATAALVIGAGTASAHVSVNPDTVAPGSYSKLTFRVPNESPTATTVKLEIQLPTDTPFASVRAKQTPGWTAALTKTTLPTVVTQGTTTLDEAVTQIVFTAGAGTAGIGQGEFAEFDISVGPVPEVASVTFIAVQTYSDGTVVTWGDLTPAGGEEPKHPAPVLTIAGAATDEHMHAASAETVAGVSLAAEVAAPEAAAAAAADGTARTLGTVGIAVGVLGLIVGAFGLRRRTLSTTARG